MLYFERALGGRHWLTTGSSEIKELERAFIDLSKDKPGELRKALKEYLSDDLNRGLNAKEFRRELYLRNIDVAVLVDIMTPPPPKMTNPIWFGSCPAFDQLYPWMPGKPYWRLRVNTWAVPEDMELEYDALAEFDHWFRFGYSTY